MGFAAPSSGGKRIVFRKQPAEQGNELRHVPKSPARSTSTPTALKSAVRTTSTQTAPRAEPVAVNNVSVREPPTVPVPERWCRATVTCYLPLFEANARGLPSGDAVQEKKTGDDVVLFYPMLEIGGSVYMRYNDIDPLSGSLRVLMARVSTDNVRNVTDFRN